MLAPLLFGRAKDQPYICDTPPLPTPDFVPEQAVYTSDSAISFFEKNNGKTNLVLKAFGIPLEIEKKPKCVGIETERKQTRSYTHIQTHKLVLPDRTSNLHRYHRV